MISACFVFFFFFSSRRRHTRLTCDWSSDGCSSDLPSGTFWLATTSPDGRPHVAGIGALWVDGKIYVVTGSGTRKGRNLAANPNCMLSVSLTGVDLDIEGRSIRITDRPTLLRLAKRYADQGWPASVSGVFFLMMRRPP